MREPSASFYLLCIRFLSQTLDGSEVGSAQAVIGLSPHRDKHPLFLYSRAFSAIGSPVNNCNWFLKRSSAIMPKVKSLRAKAAKHQPAPKLKTQEVDDSDVAEPLASTELHSVENAVTKKEKRLTKREAFQEYVAETLEKSVHSKSAQRRAKRREKERLAADMSDMGAILRNVLQEQPLSQDSVPKDSVANPSTSSGSKKKSKKSRDERGQIGESTRTKPLSKQQKKQALKLEQKRLPLILSHPQFMKDSFGTIRTHTANVLARANPAKDP